MSKDYTTICKLKKSYIEENFEQVAKLVSPVRYICKKCGRAAKDEELLCKGSKVKISKRIIES